MLQKETEDLFITRKRKKWKFAHFSSYPNCYSYGRGGDTKKVKVALHDFFFEERTLVLELAAGNAQFSLQLAKKYSSCNFIAIDVKSDRLYTSAKQALEEGIANIAFLRMHISELPKIFEPASVDVMWLTFPDPFPRERSAKHRLSHVSFLQQYRTLLKETGLLKFKTDNRALFLWSLEQFVLNKWNIHELSFDLHESTLPDDYKIRTYYEQKFIKEGLPINLVTLSAH